VAAAALAALPLAGCGESRELTTNTTGPPAGTPIPRAPGAAPRPLPSGTAVSITEREYRIEPARVHLRRPALIDLRVHNAGKRAHGLLLETSVGRLQTGTIPPGGTAEIRVRLRAGVYPWYSPVNGDRRRGMTGELVIAKPKR